MYIMISRQELGRGKLHDTDVIVNFKCAKQNVVKKLFILKEWGSFAWGHFCTIFCFFYDHIVKWFSWDLFSKA